LDWFRLNFQRKSSALVDHHLAQIIKRVVLADARMGVVLMRYVMIFLVTLFAGSARAELRTGNDIFEYCEPDGAFVAAYLLGLEDMAEFAQAVTWMRTDKNVAAAMVMRPYCPPQGSTLGQSSSVFCEYLRKHPNERHLPVVGLVQKAMKDAFPCPNSLKQ
jgi:hypothetical protein